MSTCKCTFDPIFLALFFHVTTFYLWSSKIRSGSLGDDRSEICHGLIEVDVHLQQWILRIVGKYRRDRWNMENKN